jgi:hypothetical protein
LRNDALSFPGEGIIAFRLEPETHMNTGWDAVERLEIELRSAVAGYLVPNGVVFVAQRDVPAAQGG